MTREADALGAPDRAPVAVGPRPFGHIHWLRAERPDVFRAADRFREPVDWFGLKLSGRSRRLGPTATLH